MEVAVFKCRVVPIVLLIILGGGAVLRNPNPINEDGTVRYETSADYKGEGPPLERAWRLAIHAMGVQRQPANAQAYQLIELMAESSSNAVIKLMANSCLDELSEEALRELEIAIDSANYFNKPDWKTFQLATEKLWANEAYKEAEAQWATKDNLEAVWARNSNEELIGMDIEEVPSDYIHEPNGNIQVLPPF